MDLSKGVIGVQAAHSTQYLGHNVANQLRGTQTSLHVHGHRYGRIHMCPTDIADHEDDASEGQANCQPVSSEEDGGEQEKRTEELCQVRNNVHLSKLSHGKNCFGFRFPV